MHEPISSFKISLLVASLLGGIVSLRYLRPTATLAERLISFLGACAGTYYATPVIISYFKFENGFENILAFTLGIFFMQLVDVGMRLIESYQKDPSKLLEILTKIKK